MMLSDLLDDLPRLPVPARLISRWDQVVKMMPANIRGMMPAEVEWPDCFFATRGLRKHFSLEKNQILPAWFAPERAQGFFDVDECAEATDQVLTEAVALMIANVVCLLINVDVRRCPVIVGVMADGWLEQAKRKEELER